MIDRRTFALAALSAVVATPPAWAHVARIDPRFVRQSVRYRTSELPGTIIVVPKRALPVFRPERELRFTIWRRRRPARLQLIRRGGHSPKGQMADMDANEEYDPPRAQIRPLGFGNTRRSAQSAGRPGLVPLSGQQGHALSNSRNQRPRIDRAGRLLRLRSPFQRRHQGSL